MPALREYLDTEGRSPFGKWFEGLNAEAAAKVAVSLIRLEQGNLAGVKSVGTGVLECRVQFGPGYRVYLGRDGEALIILLGGGSKKRQDRDIKLAQARWRDYRKRKREA